GLVVVEAPAESLVALGAPAFPATVAIGAPDVLALSARLRHPGAPGTAALRADTLTLDCLDDVRRPVAPATVLARVRVLWNGAVVGDVTALPAAGGRLTVPLAAPFLYAGDSASVDVRVAVNASAPSGFLELVVPLDA